VNLEVPVIKWQVHLIPELTQVIRFWS